MKHLQLPRNIRHLAITAIAAAGLIFTSGAALAGTTRTVKGVFHRTDGKNGTYVETIDTDGDTVTDTVILTLKDSKETATDITTKVTDSATHSYTVAYTHTDFGSTAQFTSNKTVDKKKGGEVGTGTYTDVAGVSGTFTTLETSQGDVGAVTAAYTPSSGAKGTSDVRLEEDALGFKAVRYFTLLPSGNTTSLVTTRYITE
jgi:hypothetical protein